MSFKIKNDGTGSNLHISQFFSMVGMNCGGPAKDKDANIDELKLLQLQVIGF